MTNFTLPEPAAETVDQLREIIAKYPRTIPLPVVAEFLGIGQNSLRISIEQGHFTWGICWQSPNRASGGRYPGKRGYKILSVPFWMAFTNNAGYAAKEAAS